MLHSEFLDRLRAEVSTANLSFEILLAFYVKEIPQKLAAVIVNEPMVQDWNVVYGIINRWEFTQRMTEVSGIDNCYKL